VVDIEKFGADKLRVSWHDPRTGQMRSEGEIVACKKAQFTAPGAGHGWALVLGDANDN